MCSFPQDRESVRARAHGEKNPWQRGSRLLRERNRVELALAGAAWQSDLCLPVFSCVSVGWLVVCVCVCLNLLLLSLSPPHPSLPRASPTSSQTSYVQGNCQAATARTSRSVTNLPASPRHWRPGSRRKRIYLICSQKHSRAADLNGMRHQAR